MAYRRVRSESILIAFAVCALFFYLLIVYGCVNKQWKDKVAMKYETRDACERLVTDLDITLCYGDVDPADPAEDEDQYIWYERD